MTLLERITALPEITPQTIKGNFTFEEFEFEILEKLNEEPDYDALQNLYTEVYKTLEGDPFNILNERIVFKTLYLILGYNFSINWANVLIHTLPLLKLDFILTKVLANDLFFSYLEVMYKEYKSNMEVNLSDILDTVKNMDLKDYAAQLKGGLDNLNEIANFTK